MKRILTLALLAACSSDSNDTPPVPDAPPPCSLVGSFRSSDVGGGTFNVISFGLTDGFFEILNYHGDNVMGPYAVSGNQVTLTDQIGSPPGLSCTEPNPDTWTFTFTNQCNTIAFTPVGTVCTNHKLILQPNTGYTLTRQ